MLRSAKSRLLWSCIRPILARPSELLSTLTRLALGWRSGGLTALKKDLLEIREGKYVLDRMRNWRDYRARLESELKPQALAAIVGLADRPLISVIMPTYNTPPKMLKKAINSIRRQWYESWELCISDDGSTYSETLAILTEASNADPRIRLRRNRLSLGISANTNMALGMVTGAYVVFMDHDDILMPQALFRIAELLQSATPDFIYSDEAVISSDDDEILEFLCRPQFSSERLRATPYIVHLYAFNTAFLRKLGGYDTSLAISQDYDLLLKVAENTDQVFHIAEILYLWRNLPSSAGHRFQGLVTESSIGVLRRHLERCGETGTVQASSFFNFFEIRYPLSPGLSVAVIIPTKNCGSLTRQCIDSIERTVGADVNYAIFVINHDSDEPDSIDHLTRIAQRHRVIDYHGAFNFSVINNFAVDFIRESGQCFSHYLFCNNDIEAIEKGWLERMLELGQKPDIAIVGAKLIYPDRKLIQHAGVGIGYFEVAEHFGKFVNNYVPGGNPNPGDQGCLMCNQELSAVTAACMLINSAVFAEIGGFDQTLAEGFGDTDLCLQVRERGYRVLFCPHATLIHHESYSRGKFAKHPQDLERFRTKWAAYIEHGDPYYNPNLSRFSYARDIQDPIPVRRSVAVRRGSVAYPAEKGAQ